jgi:hypothetical protein
VTHIYVYDNHNDDIYDKTITITILITQQLELQLIRTRGTITRPSFTQIEMVRLIIIMVARGGIGLQRSLEAAMADST